MDASSVFSSSSNSLESTSSALIEAGNSVQEAISSISSGTSSDTSLRIYYNVVGYGANVYEVLLNGQDENNLKVGYNSSGAFIEIYGIESAYIGSQFTITVTNTITQNTIIIRYSAVNYLYQAYNKADATQELKDMCLAMYTYYLCANEYYFGE